MTEHTSRACKRCDASCCRLFHLKFTKKQIHGWLKGGLDGIKHTHNVLWALKWFRRIKRPPNSQHKYWYTCTLKVVGTATRKKSTDANFREIDKVDKKVAEQKLKEVARLSKKFQADVKKVLEK